MAPQRSVLEPHAFMPAALDEPFKDLREMCLLQLKLLHQLLASAGEELREMRVYVRLPSSLGTASAQLRMVAGLGIVGDEHAADGSFFPSGLLPIDEQEDLVLCMAESEQADQLPSQGPAGLRSGSSSASCSSTGSGGSPQAPQVPGPSLSGTWSAQTAWEVLQQQEVLVLPQSGTRVALLMEQGTMVGLLVMDTHSASSASASGLAMPAPSSSGQGLFSQLCSSSKAQEGFVRASEGPGLSALRLVTPALAKACAVHLKQELQSMQVAMQTDTARGLLRDVQRRAAALNTFSAMLLPRMTAGQPDQDIAQGMANQGKRLQELVRQLDITLAETPQQATLSQPPLQPPLSRPPLPASSPLRGMAPVAAAAALPTLGWGQPVAAASRLSQPVTEPASAQPAVRPKGLAFGAPPPASSAAAAASGQPMAASVQLPTSSASQLLSQPGGSSLMGSLHPQLLHHATASRSAVQRRGSEYAATASAASGPATAAAVAGTSSSGSLGKAADSLLQSRPFRGACQPASSQLGGAAAGGRVRSRSRSARMRKCEPLYEVIDVEAGSGSDEGHASGQVAATSSSASVSSPLQQQQRQRQQPRQHGGSGRGVGLSGRAVPTRVGGSGGLGASGGGFVLGGQGCHVAEALRGLLDAALRLASVSGVHVVVQPPLSVGVGPVGPSTGAAAAVAVPRAKHAAVAAPAAASVPCGPGVGDDGVAALQPRPVLPIQAAVPKATLRRIMSYVIDIVLQCTPRGGQVCVSAQLLHSDAPGLHGGGDGEGGLVLRRDRAGGAGASVAAPRATSPCVQLVVVHSGCLSLDRLHAPSRALAAAAAAAPRPVPVVAGTAASASSGAAAASSVATTAAASSSLLASAPAGSGLLSFSMAEELVLAVGGSVTVSHPVPMVNASHGGVDTSTCIEILLPACAPEGGGNRSEHSNN